MPDIPRLEFKTNGLLRAASEGSVPSRIIESRDKRAGPRGCSMASSVEICRIGSGESASARSSEESNSKDLVRPKAATASSRVGAFAIADTVSLLKAEVESLVIGQGWTGDRKRRKTGAPWT